jgi:hypothetical protein
MPYTERFSEILYPLAIEYADSLGPAATASAYVSLQNYHRAWLVINVGAIAGGGTLDAILQQATDTAGGGVKPIAGKAITQLTQAGGDGDDLVCIELRTEELDVQNGFDCVRFLITTGAAAAEYSAVLYGGVTRYAPVPTTNWTEIIG